MALDIHTDFFVVFPGNILRALGTMNARMSHIMTNVNSIDRRLGVVEVAVLSKNFEPLPSVSCRTTQLQTTTEVKVLVRKIHNDDEKNNMVSVIDEMKGIMSLVLIFLMAGGCIEAHWRVRYS